jgi:hypothetical protein
MYVSLTLLDRSEAIVWLRTKPLFLFLALLGLKARFGAEYRQYQNKV